MPNAWTPEQILAFAPDENAAKAAQEQSAARRWTVLGLSADTAALWGLCQGSAAQPYQTQIDLSAPAFHCTCPSRKLPCKHAIGLFLLYATDRVRFAAAAPPGWVQAWLARQRERAVASRTDTAAPLPDPASPPQSLTPRQAQRLERVASGVEELQRWLEDVARQGFGALPVSEASFWEAPARRMVDAQAPGLARTLRSFAMIPAGGDGWQKRLLAALGRLHLLLEAYNRIERLPEGLQADVRALVGFTVNQAGLLESRGLRGEWLIAAQRVDDEGSNGHTLHVQRTWLWERRSGRPALALSFTAAGQAPDTSLAPGAVIDAELVYFPSATPLRALVKTRSGAAWPITKLDGYADLCGLTEAFAAALAANPWTESRPGAALGVTPRAEAGGWRLVDRLGHSLPLPRGLAQAWKLLALSGGHPLDVFGEWDGEAFTPLSCVADGQWHSLAGREAM